ncbi:twin-arginine translocation protein [[Synechococcus] sp. NIES-970]|uniref:TatA/E family twin arginine-targeting protein translocase n=1 Tax=Picosynechococcus sp. NKBG15041c TaxID=1407650 RepID=UPI000413D29B|nr:TatA/E family twin arginine-targeting protein translocase [Picosynechococcus sp. NKBG15041c]BAW96076.1 twin-arginine translocation protein [[Synechococcus] sp. NIES-970]
MNIFGIGLPEMALIFIIALLIFGPKKLPEIGRSLGKTIRSFQDASNEFQEEFKKEAEKIENTVSMQARLEEGNGDEAAVQTENAASEPKANS